MKFYIAIALLVVGAVAQENGKEEDIEHCHNSAVIACGAAGKMSDVSCNSVYGGFKHVQPDLQSYVNSQLASSYDYMLLATHFNSYQKNRPGFQKLIQGLSDKAWDNAVGLIKHITKRGGKADFFARHEMPSTISRKQKKLEVDELHALSLCLDSEKKLSNDAIHIHKASSHMDSKQHYDPEVAQYMEEEFIEYQSGTVRKLSGYTNDLSKLMNNPDPSLSVFLFDEYLQKQ